MEYRTQKQEVLAYLEKNGTINSFQCYIELQIVDLQHAIYELRKEGYNITDRWVKSTNKRRNKYKEYRLVEE